MDDLFNGLTDVDPVSPPAAYIGGKRALSSRIISLIEQTPHQRYAECFVGMGGVFFRRRRMPRSEVINDRSGDVVNLFRILQRHYQQFMDVLKFQIASRREFERLAACKPETLTDLERAARFLYLQKLAYGGKVTGRSFGVDTTGPSRFNVMKIASQLEDVHDRLSGVLLENLDWSDFIDRYDGPDILFYLDPPYFGCEGDYGQGLFMRSDFERMAEKLANIRGRFILSLNDVEEVRAIFAGFSFIDVRLSYTISGGSGVEAREVVITP
jgi:DNA adenine methylase